MNFIGSKKDIIDRINRLENVVWQVNIEKFDERKARTKNQNAFYWTLLSQYADWGKVSKIKLHNEMLMHYGQRETDGDDNFIDPYFQREINWEDATETHMYPLGKDKDTGLYGYRLLKNSRNYNTSEFSILITGLVNEIQGSGADAIIDTLTYEERCLIDAYKREAHVSKQKGKYYHP